MRILNLDAGVGGNRLEWKGHEITAVEIDPKIAKAYSDQFPNDKMIIGDAHQYLLDHFEEFDFIWDSPPCPTHSRMMKATRHKRRQYVDAALYQRITLLRHFFKGKWVIENVTPYYEPWIRPDAKIGRHYFWSNFYIPDFPLSQVKGFITKGTVSESEELKEWLGIKYEGNIYHKGNHCPGQVLRNCIHPKLGKHILDCSQKQAHQLLFQP